jgi:hypothetical protein
LEYLVFVEWVPEYNYLLHNQVLEVTKDSKYLGVTISNDLSWANHTSNITAKANRTIGFLRRSIHACLQEVKAAVYTTLVRPSIEHASTVWDPFNKNQIFQLDSVQRMYSLPYENIVFNDKVC